MSNTTLARIGAVLFALWGMLHVAGGLSIFTTGYSTYQNADGPFPPAAEAVLAFFAYLLIALGVAVVAVAAALNWRNSHFGLALNTGIIGVVDIGLVLFLVLPGHVSWSEAAIGLGLLAAALVPATLACRAMHVTS